MGWQELAGILREIRSQRSKISMVHDLVPLLLASPTLKDIACIPHAGKGKEVTPTFLLKEPSNFSPSSEIPTSLRDYNGKKPDPPSPRTGSLHTELALPLVGRQEQRGKGPCLRLLFTL